jgi:hypothetical protein
LKKKGPKIKNDPPKKIIPTMISRRFLGAKFRQNAKTLKENIFFLIFPIFSEKIAKFWGKII